MDGFKPQHDMVTWEDNVLMEQVISYASILEGETSSIQGRVYCSMNAPENNIIVIRAYDAGFTDPFAINQKPVAEHIIPFTVSSEPETVTTLGVQPFTVLVGLGVFLIVGIFYAKKEGMI